MLKKHVAEAVEAAVSVEVVVAEVAVAVAAVVVAAVVAAAAAVAAAAVVVAAVVAPWSQKYQFGFPVELKNVFHN